MRVIEKPAILGAEPIFQEVLGIVRPLLPDISLIQDALAYSLRSGQLTNNGPNVRSLEQELAEYFGVKHVISVGNATLGLMILAKSLGQSGEIVLPSFTYSATAHAVVWAGLKPVFADIFPDTYTLDPTSVERLVNENTKAIMGVHIYGHPCEHDELQAVADRFKIPLVYDAAHAFGSRYKNQRVGRFGLAEVFSFHATKIFPVGEGGAITTNDDDLARQLRLYRAFGDPGTENTQLAGMNAKMQEFNAILALENLKVIDQYMQNRQHIAGLIMEELSDIGLSYQAQKPYAETNYQNFSIVVHPDQFGLTRDELFTSLGAENIVARKYFYPPLHLHDTYIHRSDSSNESLQVTEAISENVLCLPIYSQMTDEQAFGMCRAIRRIHHYVNLIKAQLHSVEPL